MKTNKILLLAFLLLASQPLPLLAQDIAAEANSAENSSESKLTLDKVDSSRFYSKAVLQLLNKTTAKTTIAEIKVGESVELGKLTIVVRKCWQAPIDQKPDSRILLDISEVKADGISSRIFFGWMISSSPSISSLEHPIYDVTALSCKR